MPYKVPGGTVVAVFSITNGRFEVADCNQDPRIAPALAEFQRRSMGAFTPEGRCAADSAFVAVVERLLAGETFEEPPEPALPPVDGTVPMSETT